MVIEKLKFKKIIIIKIKLEYIDIKKSQINKVLKLLMLSSMRVASTSAHKAAPAAALVVK